MAANHLTREIDAGRDLHLGLDELATVVWWWRAAREALVDADRGGAR